ncbi:di- and tripeptidase [Sporothrix brasiliensis 5110]|uniref:Di-and tripeptidase n=1 Tax=Sporothrix brasiliensis 5110 TaxID=1398154 RepID=A0A0C2J1X3_9PEZI|nr:di- and tripeptidase [Sporothrix brasiliensis 5110]KIH95316.1 di- and tripeptidase [Sporothrix brasiliensis 5110]
MPAVVPPQAAPRSSSSATLAMADGEGGTQGSPPERLHDLKHDSSVLAIAVSGEYVFAGTHDGEILVWSLDSFQQVTRIQAHKRSVLCLFMSPAGTASSTFSTSSTSSTSSTNPSTDSSSLPPGPLLVSSAGDATISIWSPTTFQRLYEIYSTYDVGDIFSVALSVQHQTVYIGAQDTTIQWVKVNDPRRRVTPESAHHPDKRQHRFFDSKAVGGTTTPRRNEERWGLIPRAQTVLEVHPSAIRQFAHYGYVYSMLMARGPAHNLGVDEEVLISGGGDGTVKVWKIGQVAEGGAGHVDKEEADDSDDMDETGGTIREVMTLGHDDGASVLSLAIDGSFLYCGKLDGVIELWDLDTRQRLRVIKAHNSAIMTLQMNWGALISASANGFAAKHNTVHYGGASSDDLSSSSASASTETVSVSQKYQCISRWQAHDGKVLASATTTYKKARLYITGANDEIVSIWRVGDRCSTGALGDGQTAANGDSAAVAAAEDVMIVNLRDFVAYKTVSSRPEFAEDCHRGATFLCSLFKKLGGEVEMLQTRDKAHNPVVYAKFAGKQQQEVHEGTSETRRKRILFYGHYDVVAADTKKGKWLSDPFALKGVNGYLYGRGVSDNKGPIMAALYAVTDLLQAKSLESDVIFLIEGEEETGSRGFQETVREHQALIGPIDYILLANSYWLDDETPCLTYGLRGVLHATVCVDSANPDLHSGVDGSYMMAEPLSDLTMVLSKLKGPRNRVMIPAFYDGVLPLRPEEEARFDAITSMLVQRNPDTSEPADILKAGLMSRWREPNLTIHRYKVSGPDGSLVSCHACANISFRLVPGQELDDIVASLEAFLQSEFAALESTNTLTVHVDNKAEPWLGDPDNYIFQTLEAAIIKAWGMDGPVVAVEPEEEKEKNVEATTETATEMATETATEAATTARTAVPSPVYKARRPLYIREGGSIPAIRFLEKQFGAPAAHLPCGQASDAAHLDNERLRVVNLLKSRAIFKQVFETL